MLTAFGRCGIRPGGITADHLEDAALACNLLQVEWSNRQINLWTVDLQTVSLVQGTATYTVDPTTIMVLAAYISTTPSGGNPTNRVITSINVDDYAAYPDLTTQGQPTVYWFNTQISPVITVWQPPDANGPYTLKFYRARQIQDADLANGLQPEVPYRFLEAYTFALAAKLAISWAPDRFPLLAQLAKTAWMEASDRDVANVPLRIVPQMGVITSRVY